MPLPSTTIALRVPSAASRFVAAPCRPCTQARDAQPAFADVDVRDLQRAIHGQRAPFDLHAPDARPAAGQHAVAGPALHEGPVAVDPVRERADGITRKHERGVVVDDEIAPAERARTRDFEDAGLHARASCIGVVAVDPQRAGAGLVEPAQACADERAAEDRVDRMRAVRHVHVALPAREIETVAEHQRRVRRAMAQQQLACVADEAGRAPCERRARFAEIHRARRAKGREAAARTVAPCEIVATARVIETAREIAGRFRQAEDPAGQANARAVGVHRSQAARDRVRMLEPQDAVDDLGRAGVRVRGKQAPRAAAFLRQRNRLRCIA